ncbi:DUF6766 family protein [Luedemannella flava]
MQILPSFAVGGAPFKHFSSAWLSIPLNRGLPARAEGISSSRPAPLHHCPLCYYCSSSGSLKPPAPALVTWGCCEACAQVDSPLWSRAHGAAQVIYRNSLSIVLFAFFALAFVAHLLTGTASYNEEQALESGAPPITALRFLVTPDFWFQSMQNWQSEFLAVGCLVVLSIVLRQHGSPESKPVTAPHRQTGE